MNVITRFAPSPTGNLHIGGVRTALFNYLFTRKQGGKIFLRIEDTDRERSKPEYERNILESFEWLGLRFDNEKLWRDSEHIELHKSLLKKLLGAGAAYVSKETEGERTEVIRFRNPNKKVAFDDLIRGRIEFDTSDLGDFVIAKSMDEPLYHLAVIGDDMEMGVTHVIRAEEHISNTPRQILMLEALGLPRPIYGHIPLILAPDRTKLSKRHGAVSVTEYKDRGYLPEALLNYLALLGWNPGTEQELFLLDELIAAFDLSRVHKGGAVFDEEKLRWMNKEYLKRGGVSAILSYIPSELLQGKGVAERQVIAEMLFDRVSVAGDIKAEMEKGEFDYLLKEPTYPKELLQWKKATEGPKAHLEQTVALLEAVPESAFSKSAVKEALMSYAEAKGKGNVLWPMRVALSGREQSPDPFSLAAMLGKKTTLARLRQALNLLN